MPAKRKLTNDDGDPYWEISPKRRVTIQKYNGVTLVAIREYYEKGGKQVPGKQGISLTVDQFASLASVVDRLKSTLAADFGESLPDVPDADEDEVAEKEAVVSEKESKNGPEKKKKKEAPVPNKKRKVLETGDADSA